MVYVFDVGNVVLKNIDVLTPTIELLGVDAQEFTLDYKYYDHPLMDGMLTCDDYYSHLEHVFGIKVPGRPFSDFFNPVLNEPMMRVLNYLHCAGQRVVCASNTFAPHWNIIKQKGFDTFFDTCYLSHEMGLTKPSKAFFEYILRKEHVNADEVFFTDDYLENIKTAKEMGMKTLWYYKGFKDEKLMNYFNETC